MGNTKGIKILIHNKLEHRLKRKNNALVYYHDSEKANRIVSAKSNGHCVLAEPGDYIAIKVAPGHGELEQCPVVLPETMDFEFIPGEKCNILISQLTHEGSKRTVLTIPEGLPTWELKLIYATNAIKYGKDDNVTIGDDKPGINP